jgi:hypothetical protein
VFSLLQNVQTISGATKPSIQLVLGCILQAQNGHCIRQTALLHAVPTSKMSAAFPPLPLQQAQILQQCARARSAKWAKWPGLDNMRNEDPIPRWEFFLFQTSQTSSGAHPASSPQGTRVSPEDKAAQVWSWPLTSLLHSVSLPYLPYRVHCSYIMT